MIQLLDTALGFVAIMAMLSLLVKCLTSLIKNFVDYYSSNLHAAVNSLVSAMLGSGLAALAERPGLEWVRQINWKSLDETFLTVDKMKLFLQQLDPKWVDKGDLGSRIDLHLANLKYSFGQKMKNLALACGLAMCLLCDVNALTIWKTLYTDQQVRTTFANDYSKKALDFADQLAKSDTNVTAITNNAKIEQQAKSFRKNTASFLADVNFGVGRVWNQPSNPQVCYEFLGALLTGVLVSVGAPYWHDLLRTLSNLRKTDAT